MCDPICFRDGLRLGEASKNTIAEAEQKKVTSLGAVLGTSWAVFGLTIVFLFSSVTLRFICSDSGSNRCPRARETR